MFAISDRRKLKWALKRLLTTWRFRGCPVVRPRILRELPHDDEAHTQGLLWHQGQLIESTGLMGHSSLRFLQPETGQIERRIAVEGYWLEGIAIIDNVLTALTYTSEEALHFSLPNLALTGTTPYRGQGWGLTSDGASLLMTNGSSVIKRVDAEFQTLESVEVSHRGRHLNGLNDLAVRGERMYVNVLFDSLLLEVSKRSGELKRVVDCSQIVRHSGRRDYHDSFNGIAHAHPSDSFFVTGKHWPRLFEITIPAPGED